MTQGTIMADILVNDAVWNAISDAERLGITNHLKQHDVIQPTDNIVADSATPPPDASTPLFGMTIGEVAGMKALGWGNPVCKALCDAAAAAAVAACTATGPALAACLAAIDAARRHCRKKC
jgi:hypothetical protein